MANGNLQLQAFAIAIFVPQCRICEIRIFYQIKAQSSWSRDDPKSRQDCLIHQYNEIPAFFVYVSLTAPVT